MEIDIRFRVNLDNLELPQYGRPHGPRFHRWLPNGERDAIRLGSSPSCRELKVWFERMGRLDGNFIIFDPWKCEVDPEKMRLQGWLDAGPLHGQARISPLAEDESVALAGGQSGSEPYTKLAKRIAKALGPSLHNFVELLRTRYGQYWLPTIESWDSRRVSIGYYCGVVLGLKWWRPVGETKWHDFKAGAHSARFAAEQLPGRQYAEYLTAEDWAEISSLSGELGAPSVALAIMGRAKFLRDTDHIAEAFVQAASALELAMESYLNQLRSRFPNSARRFRIADIEKLPRPERVGILAAAAGLASDEKLALACAGIKARNKIVHEGIVPVDPGRKMLLALLDLTAGFLGFGVQKHPVLVHGNCLSPPDADGDARYTVEFGLRDEPSDDRHE